MRSPGLTIAATVLAASLAGCGKQEASAPAAAGGDTAAMPQPSEMTPEQRQAILAGFPAPYNQADLENGETQFGLCRSCHTINPGGPNMTGPNLHGVFGTKAGTHNAKFKYSDAIKAAGFTWDLEHLNGWLADPKGYLEGTKMTFAGVKDEADRRDLVAYVALETGYKPQ